MGFSFIIKCECIGFSSFQHKQHSCSNCVYVYKCTILYIEKLIFNTCTVCSSKAYCVRSAMRGVLVVTVVLNQAQHFSQSERSVSISSIMFHHQNVCAPLMEVSRVFGNRLLSEVLNVSLIHIYTINSPEIKLTMISPLVAVWSIAHIFRLLILVDGTSANLKNVIKRQIPKLVSVILVLISLMYVQVSVFLKSLVQLFDTQKKGK